MENKLRSWEEVLKEMLMKSETDLINFIITQRNEAYEMGYQIGLLEGKKSTEKK